MNSPSSINSTKLMNLRAASSAATPARTVGFEQQGGQQGKIRHVKLGMWFATLVFSGVAMSGAWAQKAQFPGVSDTEILELEDHPSPAISPLTVSIDNSPGYDDGGSGSTFGLPNEWHGGEGATPISQDFTPYIVAKTPFQLWVESYDLEGVDALPTNDPDLDGRDNFSEYAFGGNPKLPDATPPATLSHHGTTAIWTFALRDDPSIQLTLQRSTTLADWLKLTTAPGNPVLTPHPTLAGYLLATVGFTPQSADGREFLRALATP